MVKLEYKGILKKTDSDVKELYGVFENKVPEEPQIFYELLILPHPDLEPFLGKKVQVVIEIKVITVSK